MPPDRHISFDGPVNFRDIGGYPTRDGRHVRWRQVFRADTLNLSDADLPRFASLGIRRVYDLRSEMERSAMPDRLPDDQPSPVVVEAVPLVPEQPGANPLAAAAESDPGDFLLALYRYVLERSAPIFGQILSGLAEPDARPAVYHCSAGKDRTGLVTGVLLSTLGVGLDIIADDYEMTSQFRTAEHVRQTVDRLGRSQNLAPELVAGLLDAPRPAIVTALGELVERHGSVESYLTGPGGAAPDLPERLRQALLD